MEQEIAAALQDAARDAGWSKTKVAAEADASEGSARAWMSGRSMLPADKAITLMRRLPGFAQRLGFQEVRRAA